MLRCLVMMKQLAALAMMVGTGCIVGGQDDGTDQGGGDDVLEIDAQKPRDGFISVCNLSHRSSDDPIVDPGMKGASHRHNFYGNDSTDAFSQLGSFLPATTSCLFDGDTAAYWMPTATKDGQPLETMGGRMYYRRGRLEGHITAYPHGLRMIAGDSHATKNQDLEIVRWGCTKNEGERRSSPPADCGDDHVRASVTFPDCWDGVHLDSIDHKSHMAYDVGGVCPASHPVQMPHLFLDFQFKTSHGNGIRLSSDMAGQPGGQTLHADFWNAWHQDKLEAKITECFNTDHACGELN